MAGASQYLRVRFLPAKEPALYLQFQKDTLRVATTPEGLATAAPVKGKYTSPEEAGGRPAGAEHNDVALPALPPGVNCAKASFAYLLDVQPGAGVPESLVGRTCIGASFAVSVREAAGDTWSYLALASRVFAEEEETASPAEAPVLVVGDLSHPVVTIEPSVGPELVVGDLSHPAPGIEPQVGGREVGVGLRLWTGAPEKVRDAEGSEFLMTSNVTAQVENLQRNGESAPVHLDVIAPSGKSIRCEDGDLVRFGFG